MSVGVLFKHLLTVNKDDYTLEHSKLDDVDPIRARTADVTYSDYQNKNGVRFSTRRKITVSEKSKLDIEMEFKQFDFNVDLNFPFSIPKNYKRK
jgi:outer membrane lipoprotein-sorting protein